MTREENLHWLNQEIQTWENECQSKHPIKEALYAARKLLEQEPTTKNNLGVDCIPRIETIDYLCKHCPDDGECFKDCDEIKHLRQMPPVTPQEPKLMIEIDLYSVIKQKYIEREVLEKLRADIEAAYDELDGYDPDALGTFASRIDDLIDNLLSESEVKANENEK